MTVYILVHVYIFHVHSQNFNLTRDWPQSNNVFFRRSFTQSLIFIQNCHGLSKTRLKSPSLTLIPFLGSGTAVVWVLFLLTSLVLMTRLVLVSSSQFDGPFLVAARTCLYARSEKSEVPRYN